MSMLRISEKVEDNQVVRLRLDGTINNETFAELEELCRFYQSSDSKIVILDMRGVTFMNHQSARKLVQRKNEALKIINCSPFIATLLETAKTSD